MSCNAWNHSRSCNCGWGGVNYLSPARPVLLPRVNGYGTYQSFTTPNARCPVCGDGVFFYRSPSGGAVFFDNLGPPWHKHPCTAADFLPRIRVIKSPSVRTKVILECEKDGWFPLHVTNIAATSTKNIVQISMATAHTSQIVYVAYDHALLDRTAPWLMKLISGASADGEDSYLIQTLASTDSHRHTVREVELHAYRNIFNAQLSPNRQRAPTNHDPHDRPTVAALTNSSELTTSFRLKRKERKAAIHELLTKLKSQYPVIREFLPLSKGVEKQIIRKDPSIARDILQHTLQFHRNSIEYLTALVTAHTFYMLDGTAGAPVSEKQIQDAQQQLKNKKNTNTRATTNLLPSNIGLNQTKLDALIEKFNGKHNKRCSNNASEP
jgi:hypothetical protein